MHQGGSLFGAYLLDLTSLVDKETLFREITQALVEFEVEKDTDALKGA